MILASHNVTSPRSYFSRLKSSATTKASHLTSHNNNCTRRRMITLQGSIQFRGRSRKGKEREGIQDTDLQGRSTKKKKQGGRIQERSRLEDRNTWGGRAREIIRVGGTGNWQATLAVPDSEEGAELRLLRSIPTSAPWKHPVMRTNQTVQSANNLHIGNHRKRQVEGTSILTRRTRGSFPG